MSIPYFPLYVTDYEADTAHLSLEEDGAYNRLLRLCWRTPGCSIPDDPKWIMRRLRVSPEEFDAVVALVIEEFFKSEKGRLFSPRLREEFEKTSETFQKRSAAGKKGGRPSKSLKTNDTGESPEKAGRKPGESNQNHNQNHISTPDGVDDSAPAPEPPPKPRPKRLADQFPSYVDEEHRRAFIEHRKKLRKPMTERAVTLLSKNLDAIRLEGIDPNDALDLAIERGWLTVEPDWDRVRQLHPDFKAGGPQNGRDHALSPREARQSSRVDAVIALGQRRDAARSRAHSGHPGERDTDRDEGGDASPARIRAVH